MSLEERINQDIKSAMLAKEDRKLEALRAVKSALMLAKTEKNLSTKITEDAEIKILQKLVKQRKESADIYRQQNRIDLLQIEEEEQQVIEQYLPTQLDPAVVEQIIKDIIQESGATSMKEMGKVMGIANQKLAGQADGKTISTLVKTLLS